MRAADGAKTLGLVLTTYNAAEYLDQLCAWLPGISSLFDKILLVDDCSTDGSFVAIQDAMKTLPNIIFNSNEENTGRPSAGRNRGIEELNCARLVFCDADDVLPVAYVKFLRRMCDQGSTEIYTAAKYPSANPLEVSSFKTEKVKIRRLNPSWLEYKNFVTLSGASITREVIGSIRFQNCPLEDWLFWRAVARDVSASSLDVNFLRLVNMPVGYLSSPGLSPKKSRQIARVKSHIGLMKLPIYFFFTVLLRASEKLAQREWRLKHD